MGHSKEDKAASHDRIVEVAAARMRESGTTGPGVAEIMKAAGLTHGGFYKHFDSREDLVAEAISKAFDDANRATESVIEDAEDPLAAFVDWYASAAHCEDPATGCAITALGADIARGDDRVRTAYREQVEKYLAGLERLLGSDDDARRRATVALSSLVGAVLVARGVDDKALADEILRDVRESVKSFGVAQLVENLRDAPHRRHPGPRLRSPGPSVSGFRVDDAIHARAAAVDQRHASRFSGPDARDERRDLSA